MVKKQVRKAFSFVKEKTNEKIKNVRTKFKTIKIEVKQKYQETKMHPISKRKSAIIGFTTVLSIFGVVLFSPRLVAFAKDVPKSPGKCPAPQQPGQVAPNPQAPNVDTLSLLSGAAGTICAGAVNSGSFILGIVCGVVVVGGILLAQNKDK